MPRKPSLRRAASRIAALVLLGVIAGCSTRPFVIDSPPGAGSALNIDKVAAAARGPHDYNPDPRPLSLCYSSQLNTQDEVLARAQESCPNGGELSFYDEDAVFNGCPLLQPQRVTFICTPGPPPESPYN